MHYLIFQFMHSEWSATRENHFPKWQQCNFNSCTPSGVQPHKRSRSQNHTHFNSCTPSGVQLHRRQFQSIATYFNSCTPSGVQQQSIVFIFPFILYFVYVTFFYISYIIIFIKSFSLFVIIIGANLSGFLCILRIRPNFYLI